MAMSMQEQPTGIADALGYAVDHLVVPEGDRVEIIEGNIVVSPTPQGQRGLTTRALRLALQRVLPDGFVDMENVTIRLPDGQRYIPDTLVMPEDVLDSPEWLFPPDTVLLAVEVTPPGNGEIDRVKKLRGYAAAGVPLYLLIDRDDRTVSLFSDPADRIYRHHTQAPFGEAIRLPEPFGGPLDTTRFI